MRHWSMIASEANEKVAKYHHEADIERVLRVSVRARVARAFRAVAQWLDPAPLLEAQPVAETRPAA